MRGKEKAAILLIALGPEVGGNVLKQLRENEIEALTMEVFTTENVKEELLILIRRSKPRK